MSVGEAIVRAPELHVRGCSRQQRAGAAPRARGQRGKRRHQCAQLCVAIAGLALRPRALRRQLSQMRPSGTARLELRESVRRSCRGDDACRIGAARPRGRLERG